MSLDSWLTHDPRKYLEILSDVPVERTDLTCDLHDEGTATRRIEIGPEGSRHGRYFYVCDIARNSKSLFGLYEEDVEEYGEWDDYDERGDR